MNKQKKSRAIPGLFAAAQNLTAGPCRRRLGRHPMLLAIAIRRVSDPRLTRAGDWQSLFDGKTLKGWKSTDFAGRGEVTVEEGKLMLHSEVMLTGVSWTNELPRINYEVSLDAMKVDG